MTQKRLIMERKVLEKHLIPSTIHFGDLETDKPYVKFAAKTNRGNIYTLYIDLSKFPEEVPEAYVTKLLYTKDGEPMSGCSSSMHTLSPSINKKWTRICHYGYGSWTNNVSLYKVFIKCRLWLEMYELHLETGKDIDYYLSHQI
ncbi:MAG: hypothetical protein IJU90_07255 [Bacteroidales bacterium]|nr:hypothetical protein [Bacteroidales bacterium]